MNNLKTASYACIDLGSNMCRLVVARYDKKTQRSLIIRSHSHLLSLGKNKDFITNEDLNRTLNALKETKSIARMYTNEQISCIATAVFRSAQNSGEFLRKAKDNLGLHFRIIDPGEEIALTALGCKEHALNEPFFVVDMGGGSTEIGLFGAKEQLYLLDWISLPCGLFFFHGRHSQPPMPIDAHKSLLAFTLRTQSVAKKIPLIICRSLIMTLISNYMSRHESVNRQAIYGSIFEKNHLIWIMGEILAMDKEGIRKLTKNIQYVSSIKPVIQFAQHLICTLSVDRIIFSNSSLKEGLVEMVGAYYYGKHST